MNDGIPPPVLHLVRQLQGFGYRIETPLNFSNPAERLSHNGEIVALPSPEIFGSTLIDGVLHHLNALLRLPERSECPAQQDCSVREPNGQLFFLTVRDELFGLPSNRRRLTAELMKHGCKTLGLGSVFRRLY